MTREHISASSKVTLEAIDGVRKQLNRLNIEADVHIDQAKRERLLRSLKFPAFNDRRNQVSKAHGRTFEWIFVGDDGPSQEDLSGSDLEESDWEDSDLDDIDLADPSEASWDLFSNWLRSTADIYWISGKPASGKTTLVKYVLDHPKTMTYLNTWLPQSLIISHFFWRPGTLMQQSIKGLLCSLLYQLLDNSVTAANYLLQNIQAGSWSMKDEHADWSVLELRSALLTALHSYERPICIFIDGLDEVHPSDGPMELVDLVEQISQCRNAKLCLSSRPEPILEKRLSTCPRLRLQDLTRPDLQLYARDRVRLGGSIDDEAQSIRFEDGMNLIDLLVYKAEGVFLWLVLAIKSINKGFTYEDTSAMIRQRIDRLPGDLTRLYRDMWARACEDNPVAYRQLAALYFRLILLSQHKEVTRRPGWHPTVLHLMLASTSGADQLLDAIDNLSALVPEERLLQNCKAVETGLKLYCFGLIDVRSLSQDIVVGWYGTRYSTLWSRYGRREPQFVHRTAQDFLLDTVDGSEILGHNSLAETSLFLKWVRAHLAISQLFANKFMRLTSVNNLIRPYIMLLDRFPQGDHFLSDPDRTRTISHLQKLCRSGQLLCGPLDAARFCGGLDAFNATAIICNEHLLPRPKIWSFSKSTLSEILLNLCDRDFEWIFYGITSPLKSSAESLITTLLCEGADPNWRGTMFHPWLGTFPRFLSGLSLVRTPFTEYLTIILNQEVWRTSINLGWCQVATILRNLHAFLSHSANLGDAIHRVFRYSSSENVVSEHESVYAAVLDPPPSEFRTSRSSLIVAFSAYSVLKVLLDHLSTKIEQSHHGEEKNYAETMSLMARNREYLSNCSKREHSRVIGRLVCERAEDCVAAEDNAFEENPKHRWSYWSLEGDTIGSANELIGEMEKCLLDDCGIDCNTKKATIIAQVLQLPWNLQARSGHEIQELLTQLGILARTEYETHDIEGWVHNFQAKLFADGRVVG